MPTFSHLPTSIQSLIYSKVPPEMIPQVAMINRQARVLTADSWYWRSKFKTHFPYLFEAAAGKNGIDWKNEFKIAYKRAYAEVPLKIRRLFSAIKESDVSSLKLIDIDFHTLEDHFHNTHGTLFQWVNRINNDEVLNYLYALVKKQYTSGETIDTSRIDSKKRTILYWAICFFQSIDKIKALFEQGSRCTERYLSNASPVHIAVTRGRLDIVTMLVEMNQECINYANLYGHSPLDLAASEGYADIMKYLIQRGASLTDLVLLHAISRRQTAVALIIIEAGACLNVFNLGRKETPLHGASDMGDLTVVRALLVANIKHKDKDKVKLEEENGFGQTALMVAAAAGHTTIALELIGCGANLDAAMRSFPYFHSSSHGKTAFHHAIDNGHNDTALALIRAGARHDIGPSITNSQYLNLVAYAIQQNNVAIAKTLIQRHTALNSSALHSAITNGRDDIAQLLLEAGAAPMPRVFIDFGKVSDRTRKAVLARRFIKEREQGPDGCRTKPFYFGTLFAYGHTKQREIAAAEAIVSVCLNGNNQCLDKHLRVLRDDDELYGLSQTLVKSWF